MSLLSLITGSHDLQQLITTNTSNDILCLQFIFVNGSTINEVHLHLQCDHRLHLFYNEDLFRNNQLNFIKCFSDIPPGNNWTLYVCDRVLPQGNKTCYNPAVILTDISITGRVFCSSTVTASSTSFSTGIMSTTSISSKLSDIKYNIWSLFKDIMNTSTPSDNKTGPDIGIVIRLVIMGIIIILVIIVIGKYIIINVKY